MKPTKHQLNLIIFLSLIIILLFCGILYNQLAIRDYIPTTAPIENEANLLPSLGAQRRWGSSEDDELVDVFFINDEGYVFFNSPNGGKMLIVGENKYMSVEGRIESVCIAFDGFALALTKENGHVIQLLGLDGAPTASVPISYSNAQIQHLAFSGEGLAVGVRSKGVYDYVFTYLTYDSHLSLCYERVIYSVYNLSLLRCYELSNSVILFFNAEYGSVKKGCYSVLQPNSKSVETTYFPLSEGYTLLDVIPSPYGFSIACKDKSDSLFSLSLTHSFSTTVHSVENGTVDGARLYGNGVDYYCFRYGKTSGIYTFDTICKKVLPFSENARVLDCIFTGGSAVFALCKDGKTYLYHAASGISCMILPIEVESLKLKQNGKLCFFISTDHPSLATPLGGKDIYCGILQ